MKSAATMDQRVQFKAKLKNAGPALQGSGLVVQR